MQITDRVYEQLTPHQRLRVTLEAFDRRDFDEVDRLHDTVESVTVRVQSPAYFERLRGLINMATLHGIIVRDQVIAFWALAWKLEHTPETDEEAQEEVTSTLAEIIARIQAYNAAWETFCSELDIPPSHLRYFAYYDTSRLITECLQEKLDDELVIAPDEDVLKTQLEYLRDQWRRSVSRGALRKTA